MAMLMSSILIFSLPLLLPLAAHAADWRAAETEEEIVALTQDANGSPRETTIWIAVLDGDAFIRTSGTPWGRNMERDPDLVLRIAGVDHSVRAERIVDAGLIDRVQARFREKYGFADRPARFVRFVLGGSRIYRVQPR
jgi:hypothetical protein